jgi:hypothetical protein
MKAATAEALHRAKENHNISFNRHTLSVIVIPTDKYSVHCAGLLNVQNILSADTVVSRGTLKVIHSVIT